MEELQLVPILEEISIGNFLPEPKHPLDASEECILEALWVSQGSLTRASKILSCSHSSLWSYVKKHPKIKEYLDKVWEYRNDIRSDVLEDLAFNKALLGDSTILWKLLCTYANKRGYGDKQSLEIKHDVPPHIKTMLESLEVSRANFSNETIENEPKSQAKISVVESNQENKPS